MTQNLWDSAKAVIRGKCSYTILPQETTEASNRQPNSTSEAAGEKKNNNNNKNPKSKHKDQSRKK